MTGIAILSVANSHTGNSFEISLDGQPQGTVGFLIAPIPEQSKATLALFVAGDDENVWSVTVPHAGLWYVWASDDEGVTAEPGAVWVGITDNPDLEEAGLALEKILKDNKAGIEAGLRADYFPEATIKHIVYGTPGAIRAWPAVLITRPRETVQYVAAPMIREHIYQFEVYCSIVHQDNAPQLDAAARMGARLMEILNKPQYESITLASGTPLAFCGAQEAESSDEQVDEGKWAALGSCIWTGKCVKQSTGEAGI